MLELLDKLALRLVLIRKVGKLNCAVPVPCQRASRTEAVTSELTGRMRAEVWVPQRRVRSYRLVRCRRRARRIGRPLSIVVVVDVNGIASVRCTFCSTVDGESLVSALKCKVSRVDLVWHSDELAIEGLRGHSRGRLRRAPAAQEGEFNRRILLMVD
jgi:hypothetical protein